MKDFSIIIPTFERQTIFKETLDATIEAIKGFNGEIIVVNDSKKETIYLENSNVVTLTDNPKSGVASARNHGAGLANSDNLIFLDDDMILSEHSIVKIMEYFSLNEKNFYLFEWVYPPKLSNQLAKNKFGRYMVKHNLVSLKGWLGNEWDDQKDVFEIRMGASYCLCIKKGNFESIGGYNEDFPHAGAEDFEFFSRAKKLGFRIFIDKTIKIFQNEADRINLKNWLARKKRNGETIKIAVGLGYTDLAFNYNILKRIFYSISKHFKWLFFLLFEITPNKKNFDFLSFIFVDILLGTSLFEGYSIKK